MADAPESGVAQGPPAGAGLCGVCLHGRSVGNRRGSTFLLCQRSASDPSYPRYPGLPVLSCRGFEPKSPD